MLIYGKNVAEEELKKNKNIKKAYIYKDFTDRNLLSSIQNSNIPVKYMTKQELDRLAIGNHQGIILDVPDFSYNTLDDLSYENELIVILDHLEDPHNFGAIIRTAEAAGVDAIIIPKNRGVSVNSTVYKVSAGALNNIKIIMVTNLVNTMTELKDKGFWFVGTDLEGESYETIDYKGNIGIIIGNEGKGMSQLVKKNADFIATIPMKGKINSLNASVATGIIVFEAAKQRN
jgi:rRNA methylase, putative, group 3